MLDPRRTVWGFERYTGVALGLGFAQTEADETHAWSVCINLPFITATGWFWRRDVPYFCPTSGETECCPKHSGWDTCCGRPDLHMSVTGSNPSGGGS